MVSSTKRSDSSNHACKGTKSRAQNKETCFFFLPRRNIFAISWRKRDKKTIFSCKKQDKVAHDNHKGQGYSFFFLNISIMPLKYSVGVMPKENLKALLPYSWIHTWWQYRLWSIPDAPWITWQHILLVEIWCILFLTDLCLTPAVTVTTVTV